MKKSRKVLIWSIAFVIAVIGIFLFANRKPDRPATNLEFWIGENVDEVDFSGFQEKYGLFGGREYYGTGYVPTVDENGMQTDPEFCVVYTITAFPDYSSNHSHITEITITDPSVEFYGISLNTSHKDFDRLMKAQGFRITTENGNRHTAKRGKYSVIFTKDCIRIRADVSNIFGIQF